MFARFTIVEVNVDKVDEVINFMRTVLSLLLNHRKVTAVPICSLIAKQAKVIPFLYGIVKRTQLQTSRVATIRNKLSNLQNILQLLLFKRAMKSLFKLELGV